MILRTNPYGSGKMDYKFSVIIPVYNAEKTLRRCLDSLMAQSIEVAEIILINDGSQDNSLSICKEFESQYENVLVIEQQNSGAAAARNAGLEAASGEFVTFVDSDDYVCSDYFSILSEQSTIDFVIYPYARLREGAVTSITLTRDVLDARGHEDLIVGVIQNRYVGPWNKRFRREIIEKYQIRFQTDLVIGEDFVFGLHYMLHCNSSKGMSKCIYVVDESNTTSVTRAPKYDFSQFVALYDYAFQAAYECDWKKENKEKLLQQLDYQYCRTAFAASDHLKVSQSTSKTTQAELIQLFYDHCQWSIKPLNNAHTIMKFCIRHRIKLAFLAVPWIYQRIRKS